MNFFLQATEYWLALKDKGWFDEGFYREYDFICHETYDFHNNEVLEESNSLQAALFLSGELTFD